MAYSRAMFALVCLIVGAAAALGGWLNPTQNGFIIQTFTTYQAITGNNTGLIVTNGNSYQFAGDNTANVNLGGAGVQFRGKNDGGVLVEGPGAAVLGTIASLATLTNSGAGSLVLADLTAGQSARITAVGSASLLLGAGTVSNTQCIVVGDGNVSHGARSVTAGSFHGDGGGLTNVSADYVVVKSWAPTDVRYTDNGDGTITDSATGLMWIKNGQILGTLSFLNWAAAKAYCENLVTNGYSDWRLPTVAQDGGTAELDTLGRTAGNPLGAWEGFEGTAFTNILPAWGGYLSAVTNASGPGNSPSAWKAYLGNGGAVQLTDKTEVWRVLPVRGTNTGIQSHYVTLADSRGLNVGGYGFLTVASGTQLVFVAGAVTNVLDADILHP